MRAGLGLRFVCELKNIATRQSYSSIAVFGAQVIVGKLNNNEKYVLPDYLQYDFGLTK